MCICMYVCVYVCNYVCMYVCVYVCNYVCMYVCMRAGVREYVISLNVASKHRISEWSVPRTRIGQVQISNGWYVLGSHLGTGSNPEQVSKATTPSYLSLSLSNI